MRGVVLVYREAPVPLGVILAVVLSVVTPGEWVVQFTPHPLNVGINIVTDCTTKGHLVYRAVANFVIEPKDAKVSTPRTTRGIPPGARCEANFAIMRNPKGGGGDPDNDYPGETAVLSWVE